MRHTTHTYRGNTIERSFPSGMWVCFIIGRGYFKADTLKGLKELMRNMKIN